MGPGSPGLIASLLHRTVHEDPVHVLSNKGRAANRSYATSAGRTAIWSRNDRNVEARAAVDQLVANPGHDPADDLRGLCFRSL